MRNVLKLIVAFTGETPLNVVKWKDFTEEASFGKQIFLEFNFYSKKTVLLKNISISRIIAYDQLVIKIPFQQTFAHGVMALFPLEAELRTS